ncbi:MAG: hypothetical protein PHG64_11875 [Paludibacter sp.]|nr:hypothetical protein [Paludibacter sp.]
MENDYEDKLKEMHKHGKVSTNDNDSKYIPEMPGTHQHTFTATWNCNQSEPDAKIYNDGPLILDILLLWSLWSNRYVCTGDRVVYEQHHYYNDKYFLTDENLINAIESALGSLEDKQDAKNKKLFPATFLIKESNLIQTWQYKVLYLSPAIDLVSRSFAITKEEIYGEEGTNQIENTKKEINKLIDKLDISKNVKKNTIERYKNDINRFGSPTPVDYLNRWVLWTLDINDPNERDSVYDNCKAFNHYRNSVVHYIGLPKRKIKIRFSGIPPVEIPININENESIRTKLGIFYFFVYREMLQIWMAKVLGVKNAQGARFGVNEVMEFIQTGVWRGVFILA